MIAPGLCHCQAARPPLPTPPPRRRTDRSLNALVPAGSFSCGICRVLAAVVLLENAAQRVGEGVGGVAPEVLQALNQAKSGPESAEIAPRRAGSSPASFMKRPANTGFSRAHSACQHPGARSAKRAQMYSVHCSDRSYWPRVCSKPQMIGANLNGRERMFRTAVQANRHRALVQWGRPTYLCRRVPPSHR
jgi:hypothetical protein